MKFGIPSQWDHDPYCIKAQACIDDIVGCDFLMVYVIFILLYLVGASWVAEGWAPTRHVEKEHTSQVAFQNFPSQRNESFLFPSGASSFTYNHVSVWNNFFERNVCHCG